MNDLSTLTAQPRRHTIAGRAYEFHQLTINDLGALETWAQGKIEHPLSVALEWLQEQSGVAMAMQKHIIATATELAARPKPRIGSPEIDGLIRSAEGSQEMLYLSIRKGDPSFTREQAKALYDMMTMHDLDRVFGDTGVKAALSDPKAPTNGSPTNPSAARTGGNSTTNSAASSPGEVHAPLAS